MFCYSTKSWPSWNGYRTLWMTHSRPNKTFRPSTFYLGPPPLQKPKPPNPPPHPKRYSLLETPRFSNPKRLSQARLVASGHAPPRAIGRRDSSTSHPLKRTKNRWYQRKKRVTTRTHHHPLRPGSVYIVRPIRPHSGVQGLWAQRLFVTLVESGSNQGGSCLSTGPLPAQLLFPRSTPIHIGKCWS